MEMDVFKVSEMVGDLFRTCRRKADQSVTDFNLDFGRMIVRFQEITCTLSPVVKACVRMLQQAALLQDRPRTPVRSRRRTRNACLAKHKRCGHRRKDPEFPLRGKAGDAGSNKVQSAQVCNQVFVPGDDPDEEHLARSVLATEVLPSRA